MNAKRDHSLFVSAVVTLLGLVVLLGLGLEARLRWWIKAIAIVATSAFMIVVFFATNGPLLRVMANGAASGAEVEWHAGAGAALDRRLSCPWPHRHCRRWRQHQRRHCCCHGDRGDIRTGRGVRQPHRVYHCAAD